MRATRAVVGGVAVCAALLGCGQEPQNGAIVVSGYVEATEVRVGSKVGGVVASLEADEGDRVSVGQELVRIDTTDLELALGAARAERDVAEAALRLYEAGARKEDIEAASAQLSRARSELEAAERDLERMQGLLERGSGTAKLRDDARLRRDLADAAVRAAREQLGKLRAGARPEELDTARARVAAADARIAQIEQQLEDASIECPLAGLVTERLVESGELVGPGSTLLLVTDLGDAWLNVYLGEPDVARIRIGQSAEVTTDDGQQRPGRVDFIASQAEFTPKNVQTRDERVKLVFKVKIGLPNDDGLFKPGMPAQVRLQPGGGASS